MLKLSVLHFSWRKVTKSSWKLFSFLFVFSASFFPRPVYIYLWPIPASWFFGDSINSNSRSFSLYNSFSLSWYLLFSIRDQYICFYWCSLVENIRFSHTKKKYPDLYVSFFYLTFRIGLENQTKSWLQAVYILSGLNSLWFSRELGSNYKHRGSLT